jgi:hypothetical protein
LNHAHDKQLAVKHEVVPLVVFVMLAFSPDDDGGDEI